MMQFYLATQQLVNNLPRSQYISFLPSFASPGEKLLQSIDQIYLHFLKLLFCLDSPYLCILTVRQPVWRWRWDHDPHAHASDFQKKQGLRKSICTEVVQVGGEGGGEQPVKLKCKSKSNWLFVHSLDKIYFWRMALCRERSGPKLHVAYSALNNGNQSRP